MNSDSLEHLDSILLESTAGLFESLGVRFRMRLSTPAAPQNAELACQIGFASSCVRGHLLVLSDTRSMRRCLPPELRGAATERDAAEWIGEFANQLLGRLKNRLFSYGLEISIGTPSVLRGTDISFTPPEPAFTRCLDASGTGTALSVLLGIETERELELVRDARDVQREGEGTLF